MFKSRLFLVFAVFGVIALTAGCFHRPGGTTQPGSQPYGDNGASQEGTLDPGEQPAQGSGQQQPASQPVDPASLDAMLKQSEQSVDAFSDADSVGNSVNEGGKTLK